jgi:hypothetical protein
MRFAVPVKGVYHVFAGNGRNGFKIIAILCVCRLAIRSSYLSGRYLRDDASLPEGQRAVTLSR